MGLDYVDGYIFGIFFFMERFRDLRERKSQWEPDPVALAMNQSEADLKQSAEHKYAPIDCPPEYQKGWIEGLKRIRALLDSHIERPLYVDGYADGIDDFMSRFRSLLNDETFRRRHADPTGRAVARATYLSRVGLAELLEDAYASIDYPPEYQRGWGEGLKHSKGLIESRFNIG